jgi:hypothetical protein
LNVSQPLNVRQATVDRFPLPLASPPIGDTSFSHVMIIYNDPA